MICDIEWYRRAVLYLKSLVNAWPSTNTMRSFLNMIIIYNYNLQYIQFGPDFTERKMHLQRASDILHTTRGFTLKFCWLSALTHRFDVFTVTMYDHNLVSYKW